MISFKRFTDGLLGSNTYLLYDESSGEACVIDVGNPPDGPLAFARSRGLKVRYIILTHGHYDHVLYIDAYAEKFPDAVTAMHPLDDIIMEDPRLNCSLLFGSERRFTRARKMLDEGDVLKLGEAELKILHTPGHTEGGICVLAGDDLFSGDTLFYDSFGRTDLGRGDMVTLKRSIDRLFALPEMTRVHPGHGTATTIGREKRDNPILYMI